MTPDGTLSDEWTGLTAVTDVAISPDGTLYAAEMATGNLDEEPFLRPGSGRVVRQNGPDGVDEVLTDVAYPVTLGFDPDRRVVRWLPRLRAQRRRGARGPTESRPGRRVADLAGRSGGAALDL